MAILAFVVVIFGILGQSLFQGALHVRRRIHSIQHNHNQTRAVVEPGCPPSTLASWLQPYPAKPGPIHSRGSEGKLPNKLASRHVYMRHGGTAARHSLEHLLLNSRASILASRPWVCSFIACHANPDELSSPRDLPRDAPFSLQQVVLPARCTSTHRTTAASHAAKREWCSARFSTLRL